MKEVMRILIDAGAKDLKCMQRVEILSDEVLENLENRINPALLERSDYGRIKSEMLGIAKDLDSVRATPATGVVEGYMKTTQDKIDADQEKKAKGHMDHLKQAMDGLKDPKAVVPKSNEVLDIVEKAHAEAPGSKTVTDILLKCVISLSSIILKQKAGWLPDVDATKGVQDIAERVDGIARKLVQLMEAAWDPPMVPQIEHEVKAYTSQLCKQLLASAQQELKSQNVGGTFDALDSLRPWWPKVKDVDGVSLELVGLFSKVHTCASQEFTQATKEGDTETAEAIREFAKKLDALRPAFEGLPPPTEAEQQGLAAALDFTEAKAKVEKQLEVLDAEIGKATDDDKTTQLSLAKTVQALEALVPVWATVFERDSAFGPKLQGICDKLEAWALESASACAAKKVDGLVKFAEAYDDRRVRLAPPEPEGAPLRRRIAEKAAEAHLKVAEGELAKEKGLNPIALLESLRSCSASFQIDVNMEAIQGRLSSAFEATAERVTKTFGEALAAGDGRKEDMLQQFSVDFDAAWTAFKEAGELESTTGLGARLDGEREKVGGRQVDAIREALPETGKADFAALIKVLAVLRSWWPKLAEGSPLREQVTSSLAPLDDRLDAACNEAVEARSGDAAEALLRQAGELDSTLSVLMPERKEDSLRSRAVSPAVSAHAGAMEAALWGEGPVDCALLAKELAAVQPLVQDASCSEQACNQLLDVLGAVEAPLVARVADGAAGKAEAELRVATAADETLSILEKSGRSDPERATGGIRKRLEGAVVAAAKLGEMRSELAKPSGMNPRLVVQALQALQSVWSPVAEMEAFTQRLTEALEQFHARMEEACRKATGVEAKIKALFALAEDADAKQQALVPLSPRLKARSFRESLTRVVAGDHLKAMEAELAKDSGLNPAQLLKSMGELSNLWPQIGKAASGPAHDSISSLQSRAKDVSDKVHARMNSSFQEALAAGNKKKEAALLNFAREFDAANGPVQGDEPGEVGALLQSLQAQAGGSSPTE